ncbi:hypothetical protein MNV49_006684 [Pseudohyphozyma bogoriensis]|nr:hypothetical protein MNV49_006684 [Pseudohyphozyma bogoriensis]
MKRIGSKSTRIRQISTVARASSPTLPSPLPATPLLLANVPPLPALQTWLPPSAGPSKHRELELSFFAEHADPIVPLEHTTATSFDQLEAPLSFFLSFLASPPPDYSSHSLYLAQFAPPPFLLETLALPDSLLPAAFARSNNSIWLGLAPTTTPLHRDPEHNLLLQLAGTKRVRLWPPDEGESVLARVRKATSASSGKLRGVEMFQPGPHGERDELEELVWGSGSDPWRDGGVEASLVEGTALYIPRGWWHAVRGVKTDLASDLNVSFNQWL